MKKKLRIAWSVVCLLLAVAYIISSLGAYIHPSFFPYIIFFTLAFPYLLTLMVVFCITGFFIQKKIALLLLVLIPLGWGNTMNSFALNLPVQWQQQKESGSLRVMTWNVRSFNVYLPDTEKALAKTLTNQMLEVIHGYNPDVLCMQDFRDVENSDKLPSIKWQLDSLGYKYYFCSNDTIIQKNSTVYTGVVIVSKLPFADTGLEGIGGSDNRKLIYTDIQFAGKPLRLLTAHLESFAIYRDSSANGSEAANIESLSRQREHIDEKLIRTEKAQEQQVNIIRKKIDTSPYPVIYCGDINSTPASYNYRVLKGSALQDAFLVKGSGTGATFYKLLPGLRIDVCLVDNRLNVEQCKVDPKRLSDHYPVITDVRWKE